ncbi:hypothetical protein SAY86_001923 [Trapa natans]|uniref:Uncharacterized protein n=1 Tax=Trapa natans TaxID=22666 RepID=A0AAN7LJD4_TRANT|nr:hypothetical protein SAY86_001923 [Trapa natans]
MYSTSTQFVSTRRIAMYEPQIHQVGMWGDSFKPSCSHDIAHASVPPEEVPKNLVGNQSNDASHGTAGPPNKSEQEASTQSLDKVQRRLAQNREAARKSRLRKKAYVQQLEASRSKLAQLEQDFKRARHQGMYIGGGVHDPGNIAFPAPVNEGISEFETEYKHWVDEQNRQIRELRNALNVHLNDVELRVLVENGMKHYFELFQIKAVAAKEDVFYIMCGLWKTSSERFFLWIGGFRPSELLKVIVAHLNPLDDQFIEICNLRQSCQQAEEALSQGMDKLQHNLAETVAFGHMGDGACLPPMAQAVEKLEALVSFVNQADHLRQETLLQMSRILSTRQTAQALLALGEYFQRLRALSSLWAAQLCEAS